MGYSTVIGVGYREFSSASLYQGDSQCTHIILTYRMLFLDIQLKVDCSFPGGRDAELDDTS